MTENNTPKKKVRFQLDEDVEANSTVSSTTSASTKPGCKKIVRFADEYPPPSNLETSTLSSTIVEPPSSLQTLPLDADTPFSAPLTVLVPSSSITPAPTISTSVFPATPPTPTGQTALDFSSTGVAVLQYDEGEKDAAGKVMEPVPDEPCEECGGKTVWATKGECYLICQDCQEPQ
jgi:hypothetical protein